MKNKVKLVGLEIDVTVFEGRNLVAKDRDILNRRKSSDAYIQLYFDGKKRGQTSTKPKTLSPVWNERFKFNLDGNDSDPILISASGRLDKKLEFRIFDEDKFTDDDRMGIVLVPLPRAISGSGMMMKPMEGWFPVTKGNNGDRVSGEIRLRVDFNPRKAISLFRGNVHHIQGGSIRVGLGWDMDKGTGDFASRAIDLDTSAVAIDRSGNILMDETVYYGNLKNTNSSVNHSGDEREGDENLGGSGDDEVILCHLDHVPSRVLALYFVATVATPDKTFSDVKSALVRFTDMRSGLEFCNFTPALSGENTAIFLCRIARDEKQGPESWVLSVIEDSDRTARDFGSLIPEIKGYSQDIVPGIKIDLQERIAIMRKGGAIRVRDYVPDQTIPDTVGFGLAWDVTNGVNIDLDASAICLDSSFNVVDTVCFKHLHSIDGAIRHSGDEREGDEVGDDEKMFIRLGSVSKRTLYIGFIVNSFSGQELDDVSRASCHLFDPSSGVDIARYTLSNGKELDGYTALVMGCLYLGSEGDNDDNEWCLRIISEAAHGRFAQDNVDEFQRYLESNRPQPLVAVSQEQDIVINPMPEHVPVVEEDIVIAPF